MRYQVAGAATFGTESSFGKKLRAVPPKGRIIYAKIMSYAVAQQDECATHESGGRRTGRKHSAECTADGGRSEHESLVSSSYGSTSIWYITVFITVFITVIFG